MPTRAWHCQQLALVSAQLSLQPMIGLKAGFLELRVVLANGAVGWHSLPDPLLVVIEFLLELGSLDLVNSREMAYLGILFWNNQIWMK